LRVIDINTWNRKQHYEHFTALTNPYFSVTIPFNVSKAYNFAKSNSKSFFAIYLHACMKAINSIENLRYRIENEKVVDCGIVHASATIMRANKTFGFSFIKYKEDLNEFINNINAEKNRIESTNDLYPPQNGLNCIHCSAMPWFRFSGQVEPVSNEVESVPKLAFSKAEKIGEQFTMNVAITVNHALVDGYHIGLFSEGFQRLLNSN